MGLLVAQSTEGSKPEARQVAPGLWECVETDRPHPQPAPRPLSTDSPTEGNTQRNVTKQACECLAGRIAAAGGDNCRFQ